MDEKARHVHLSRSFKNRAILTGTLTPIARSIIDKEVRRLTGLLFDQDWDEAVERPGDGNVTKDDLRRDPAQRRHDALVSTAIRSAIVDGEAALPEPMIYVHTSPADMAEALEADAALAPGQVRFDQSIRELEDSTPINLRTLLRLLIRAKVRRSVFDPIGEVINAGPGTRFFSRLQADISATRDRVCSCGCGLSARLCESDHVIDWRDDGTTDIANSQALTPIKDQQPIPPTANQPTSITSTESSTASASSAMSSSVSHPSPSPTRLTSEPRRRPA